MMQLNWEKTFHLIFKPGIVFLFLFSLTSPLAAQETQTDRSLYYQFSWDGKSSVLEVNLDYYGLKNTPTHFFYGMPEMGNQVNIFHSLKITGSTEDDLIRIDTNKREIIISHKDSGKKHLHYTIDGSLTSPAKHNNANEQFRPQIAKGCFYSLSFNIFLKADSSVFKNIVYRWTRLPSKTRYFSSAAPASEPVNNVKLKIADWDKVYIAIENKLQTTTYPIGEKIYYAVTSGRDTTNDMQKCLKPFFQQFLPAIADFWNDKERGYYFLSVLPFLNSGKDSHTGVGLYNGFSMRYNGRYDTVKMETIAHEISHRWIGNKLTIQGTGMEYAWFEEGFNDYVDTYILAKTGMLSAEQFADYVNKTLSAFYQNPVREAKADSITKYFWKNGNYERLPYQKGFIYAFYLDNQIRINSAGKYTLRDFLLRLLAKRNTLSTDITINDFTEASSSFLPKSKVEEEVSRYMQNGQLLDFHSARLIDAYQINFKDGIPFITLTQRIPLSQVL
ncbi:M1 family aminopeptidase [Mucilaginibacter oryzae]|nr:M1 family aminopeptidase [Mucilaginibacter oryzae]